MNLVRNCPTCDKELYYKNIKSRDLAEKNGSNCNSCRAKIVNNRPEVKEKNRKANSGSNNAMSGKSWYDIWIKKYGKDEADKRLIEFKQNKKSSFSLEKLIEKYGEEEAMRRRESFLNKMSKVTSGKNNPMSGKNFYDIWVEKYGKEEADKRHKKWKEKISKATAEKNNPMYGKPSPQGSGNGWKGHYKGVYFASLKELFYIKYLIDNNIKFENGEQRKYKIPYEFSCKKYNYFLDFYLPETDEYIEIKPKRLNKSPKNIAKFEAAKEILGDKFKVLNEDDLQQVDLETMYNLYLEKEIIFMKKYEEKFLDYYNQNKEKSD
jgi:hypothetical protein